MEVEIGTTTLESNLAGHVRSDCISKFTFRLLTGELLCTSVHTALRRDVTKHFLNEGKQPVIHQQKEREISQNNHTVEYYTVVRKEFTR